MQYRVYIDSNFHQMDTSARTMYGEYDTYAQAIAAARQAIDTALESARQPGMSASELLEVYARLGEEPFIIPDDTTPRFDGRDYARTRCEQLCR